MSSNINDNNPLVITLDNYEEYMLMYVDDELSAQERSLVEAFLKFHPELQAELDLLMSTKLEPELLSFGDKESLLAGKIGEAAIDESLLMHVDGELDGVEKEKVEERLQQDQGYRKQHELLLRTKSDPAEVVPYPNKEELYRHTVVRMRFTYALRIAAAVLLLASMGVVYWTQQQQQVTEPAVAVNSGSAQQQPANSPKAIDTGNNNAQGNAAPERPQEQQLAKTDEVAPSNATQLAQATKTKPAERTFRKANGSTEITAPIISKEAPAQQLAYQPAPVPERLAENSVVQGVAADKKNFDPGVTSSQPQAYSTQDAYAAEPSFASFDETGKKGKDRNFKVLLRKATRIVERRTNIDATNDNEELLIGALAIKLK